MSRIIAGRHGGQRLRMPAGQATRPTSDRVREAAFAGLASWLGATGDPASELSGCAFLDLYGGSGAVACEAASRGADPVVCVEADGRAAATARRNIADTGSAVQLVTAKVERYLETPPARGFDLIWLDPPYGLPGDDLDAVLTRLVERGWVAPGGLVVLERSARTPAPAWPARLGGTWNRRYGETTLYFASEGAV